MPAAYPSTLPPLQRASKSRKQAAAFAISEPRRGYGYVQATGTDVPVFWDGQFRFSASDSIVFQLWMRTVINNGVDEFTMPLRTEFGLIDHVCRFLPDGLGDASESGGIYTYPVQIMARAQVVPAGYTDAAALIIGLPNWTNWSDYLDRVVNQALPES